MAPSTTPETQPGTQASLEAPVTLDEQVAAAEWDHYVERHPGSVAYHLHAWRGVFERAFGHRTIYLAARRGGELAGVLPLVEMKSPVFGRFLVSLPFVNYGGVLADDVETERLLFARAGTLAQEHRLDHVELRHFTPHFPGAPSRQHKVTMLLPLAPDPDAMWAVLDRKVRNQVRKAEKSGLVSEVGGPELIDAFYPVFATNMRDLGTPVYARRLFEEVFAALPGRTRMFVVRAADGRPVAAGVGLRHRDTVEMPWASSLREFKSASPNNLLYWEALKYAIGTGATTFDFGRSTPNEGTYNFKAQWGAEPVPLCWEYRLLRAAELPDHSPKNAKFSLAIRAWQRLPLPLANLLGPMIVRSIP
ncbi:MAG: FemAB family XrtA/PEP-CTERM system-associated protein [Vicinamibacterales bacterium]